MTWIRLDDDFPAHRKVRRLTDSSFRLHVSALCWSAKYLTDGYVAPEDLRYIGGDLDDNMDPLTLDRAAKELVDHGLWHEPNHDCPTCPASQNGWIIHDFLDLNPSAADVRKQRAQATERQRRLRSQRRHPESDDATNRMSRRDNSVSHASVTPDVTRESQDPTPTPTPTPHTSLLTTFEESSEPTNDTTKTRPSRQRTKQPAAEDDPEFARWWNTYPRRDAKGAARKAWTKARTKVANADVLDAAAARYRDLPNRSAEFTKLASTWLNQECWLDEGASPGQGDQQRTNGHRPYRDTHRSRDEYLGAL